MLSAKLTNEKRKAVYKRDFYSCAICGNTNTIQIHHVTPRGHGGKNTMDNLITVCGWCHAALHGSGYFLDEGAGFSRENYELAAIEYLDDMYAYEHEAGIEIE